MDGARRLVQYARPVQTHRLPRSRTSFHSPPSGVTSSRLVSRAWKTHCARRSRDIARIDPGKAAVAPAGIIAVIGNPVRRWRLNQKIFRSYIDLCGYARGCHSSPEPRGSSEASRDDAIQQHGPASDAKARSPEMFALAARLRSERFRKRSLHSSVVSRVGRRLLPARYPNSREICSPAA